MLAFHKRKLEPQFFADLFANRLREVFSAQDASGIGLFNNGWLVA